MFVVQTNSRVLGLFPDKKMALIFKIAYDGPPEDFRDDEGNDIPPITSIYEISGDDDTENWYFANDLGKDFKALVGIGRTLIKQGR